LVNTRLAAEPFEVLGEVLYELGFATSSFAADACLKSC
jgi:hypothetical protein